MCSQNLSYISTYDFHLAGLELQTLYVYIWCGVYFVHLNKYWISQHGVHPMKICTGQLTALCFYVFWIKITSGISSIIIFVIIKKNNNNNSKKKSLKFKHMKICVVLYRNHTFKAEKYLCLNFGRDFFFDNKIFWGRK